jgi:hypothetical protein
VQKQQQRHQYGCVYSLGVLPANSLQSRNQQNDVSQISRWQQQLCQVSGDGSGSSCWLALSLEVCCQQKTPVEQNPAIKNQGNRQMKAAVVPGFKKRQPTQLAAISFASGVLSTNSLQCRNSKLM